MNDPQDHNGGFDESMDSEDNDSQVVQGIQQAKKWTADEVSRVLRYLAMFIKYIIIVLIIHSG